MFVHGLSAFLIISRNTLPRVRVSFSPSVGWCQPIGMLHTDLLRDPEQHPVSRLYLRNDLFALCILVWVADIYFHFDIWTAEHTSGTLAGRNARSVLADSIGRATLRQKSRELLYLCSSPMWRHEQHFILGRWGWRSVGIRSIPERKKCSFSPSAPEDCLRHPHGMRSRPAFQNCWTPDGITIWTHWPWPACPWPHTFL